MSVPVRRFLQRWLLVVGVVGSVAGALPAAACLNGITHAPPRDRKPTLVALRADEQPINHLLLAEAALRLDDPIRSAAELDSIRLAIEQASPRLKSRFERVSALVAIRSEGQWPRWVTGGAPNNFLEREATMKEALAQLRRRATEVLGDPLRLTDLGLALFGLPEHHGEARQVLETLAAKDLLTNARGYYALSRLRAAAGNRNGAAEALASCQKLDADGKACGARQRGKV